MKRLLLFSLALLSILPAQAQYFGRNKPVYKKLDFQVRETEHFTLYEYLNNPEEVNRLAAAAEQWYHMHQLVLRDSFEEKNPLIIYSDHAGFQQNNVISGNVSVGTGGVTDAFRNRVIFPIAMTNQQTNHVLGHEMVHAFQYHLVLNGDSTNINSLANLPLWMVEGLAEYLSIGRVDAHTALWMRDAVLNDDLPRIKDLDGYKYFPYRWGQAFWAYVTGVYGDEVIRSYFMNTAKYGLKVATPMTLGVTVDSLSEAWRSTLKSHYGRWVTKGKKEDLPGKALLTDKNAGSMNICPVLSPNGKYVIFLSEKNLFTTDLFLADAKTGKILKKVASTGSDGHIDQFNFLESAGTWSPDDKRFAFDVYQKGQSVLVIKEVFKKHKTTKIKIPGVPAFANPVWSPDGKSIVVSGLVNGQTDLYAYHLKTKKVTQLTNDRYAEILPSFSADGKQLVFSTDHLSIERGRTNGAWTMNLAVLDLESGQTTQLDVFPGADNLNPQFDKTGNILFLSDRDGFRNLYRYEPATKKIFQRTKLLNGITGITPYSPAFTIADDRDRILYTYYNKGEYKIYQAKSDDFLSEEVTGTAVDMVPATLPPFSPRARDIVNTNMRLMDNNPAASVETPKAVPYKAKFRLDYMGGSAGVGVMTGNRSFGNNAGGLGGVDMLFGDILGNNQLYVGAALNGEVQDAAFQASYINRKNPVGWGVGMGRIPYVTGGGYLPYSITKVDGYPDSLLDVPLGINRQILQQLNAFAFLPFSATKRVEVGLSADLYTFTQTIYHNYYTYYQDQQGYVYPLYNVGSGREKGGKSGPLDIYSINAAFVGDNSYFGLTAPLQGWRYRLALEQYVGYWNFTGLLLDGRRYFYLKPVTLAVRGLAYGRFGGNANLIEGNSYRVQPLFLVQPWFVRGYPYNFLYNDQPDLIEAGAGSKMLLGNFEVRLPFTGPRRLSLLPSNFLMTDLNLFFDAGVAFFETSDLKNPDDTDPYTPVRHKPIMSAGASVRVNLFGALVLEPYVALPLTAPAEQRTWQFGLNFIPGW